MSRCFALSCIAPILAISIFGGTLTAAEPAGDSIGAAEPGTDRAIYGQGVRETPWLTPEDEQKTFHLPPGFEARLFAAEPEIAKPLNMAFDDQGRMWVTNTVEYPYAVKEGEVGRDAITILEDTDGDGTADKVTTFADKLNIPIGILPYGNGCIAFSIPNIWYFQDTDGDGQCDRRDIILGPFDTSRDTHGMINAFRDGGDGWIYACHGFNNQSEVAGTDGHVVRMPSGNTFRFRPDGSRIEQVTHGQVNPFGMTVDEWGYRYSADCHSKPITQLIRGACYPSFGRPHDGLGFLPPMVDHLHGSTAICGIAYVPCSSPIVPLRGQMISGNVMTSRINRNEVIYHGATAKGRELPDFMTSDDPWFRPVDIRLGPDGHIYIADFYNKIIGHYEVRLDHPERDRTSGRIWQIRYTGGDAAAADKPRTDAIEQYSSINEWLNHESPHVRLAGLRSCDQRLEKGDSAPSLLVAARAKLGDQNAHVVRLAAEVLGKHGAERDVEPLLKRLPEVAPDDPVLRQSIRIAIRDLLRKAPADSKLWSSAFDNSEAASILLGLQRSEAATALLDYLSAHPNDPTRKALLAHAAKNATGTALSDCIDIVQEITRQDRKQSFQLLTVVADAQNARPGNVAAPLRQWALELVDSELTVVDPNEPLVGWRTWDGAPWPREPRRTSDGGEASLTSSFGRGETYTGRLVSDRFAAPNEISFWLAGHNGFPGKPDHGKNRVRLIDADSGNVIEEVTPPRNDTAIQVRWDTSSLAGEEVRIECIDEDSATAYAWLAMGRFDPISIHASPSGQALLNALQWIRRLGLEEAEDRVESLLRDSKFSLQLRIELARTLTSLRGNKDAAIVLQFLSRAGSSAAQVDDYVEAVLAGNADTMEETTKLLCKSLSFGQQRQLASAWAREGGNIDTLVEMAERGWVTAEVFVDRAVQQAVAPRLSPEQLKRLEKLTSTVNTAGRQKELIARLQQSLASHQADRENGHRLFTKHCAACHQLRGEGKVVGPQLDGAVARSRQRLLEDIVTPDRNVDEAFRTTSFLLDDGQVVVGLVTVENDSAITVVGSDGKPVTVDPASVELRKDAGRSLMPANMGEVLTPTEFADLIGFVRSR